MSPEVLEQKSGYDYKADIWSFGITAIELATGSAPYQQLHPLKVMKSILELPPPKLEGVPHLDPQLSKLVAECLQKDPTKRPTIDQIITKYKAFFDKADPASVVDILNQLPPLEARDPPKPPGYRSPRRQTTGDGEALSGEWHFDDEEVKDNSEFQGLGESEF